MASATPPPTSSSLWRSRVPCSAERQGLFSRIAPVYDKLNDVLSLGQHLIWKRMSVSWAGSSNKNNAERKGGIEFWICAVEAVIWRFSCPRKSDLMARWIEGDALDLPFADSCFDAMTVGYGLRNLLDKQRAMKEIFRVLKPGSRVSILDFNKSTSSLITQSQEWMIDNVVVPVASNYRLSKEYRYLKASIAEYLTGKELEKLAKEVGFSDAKHYEIAGGLMGNLVATR
ncbi:2-phytyl-1,4-beta-naphthoquinone methyltransferase, chloroplastic isoform X3 [Elaeis guineensis]|uniref:2-phytyl-1,4-beta-naphthoquinone methyltransferase, chloroplastic isoform X3 n=1 Tax=Elaeis guineensis var. tenera TaxID=51953 RepID=UPI003C6D332E